MSKQPAEVPPVEARPGTSGTEARHVAVQRAGLETTIRSRIAVAVICTSKQNSPMPCVHMNAGDADHVYIVLLVKYGFLLVPAKLRFGGINVPS